MGVILLEAHRWGASFCPVIHHPILNTLVIFCVWRFWEFSNLYYDSGWLPLPTTCMWQECTWQCYIVRLGRAWFHGGTRRHQTRETCFECQVVLCLLFVIILYDEFSARVWAQANNDGFSLVDPISVHLALEVPVDTECGTYKVDEVGECGQQFKQVCHVQIGWPCPGSSSHMVDPKHSFCGNFWPTS